MHSIGLYKIQQGEKITAETVDMSQPAQESKQSFEKMLEVDEGQLVNAKDGVPGGVRLLVLVNWWCSILLKRLKYIML